MWLASTIVEKRKNRSYCNGQYDVIAGHIHGGRDMYDEIIKIAKYMNVDVIERTIDRTELYTCDEAFLCGSAMEITPILSIDGYNINDYNCSCITSNLHELYLKIAKNELILFRDWTVGIYE